MMKLSPIALSLSVFLMGTAVQANATTLQPSAETAEQCYVIDDKDFNEVEQQCEVSNSSDCQAFNERLEQLANEEGVDDDYAQ